MLFFYWLTKGQNPSLLSSTGETPGETPRNPSITIPNWLQRDTSQLIEEKCSELQTSEAAVSSSMYEDSGVHSMHVPTLARSFSPSSDGNCACIICMKIGLSWYGHSRQCCVVGCTVGTLLHFDLCQHEKTHFKENGKYHCREARCTSSFNRWEDLLRHTNSKHCLNPPKFHCSEIDCQYHSGNGFTRKDKLQSHYKNVHQGRPKFSRSAQPARIAPRQ